MFNPETDRVEFFARLMPREGYETDFAIGTTYSLDLETALCVPLSMEMRADSDSKNQKSDICKIAALEKTADKIALFCNNGQISADKIPSGRLHILLEKMIFPVTIPNEGKHASFHSKFWLIRFKNKENENDVFFRLIVLSRNLTADKSWDVIYSEDSVAGKEANDKNENLQNYVRYLAGRLHDNKTKKGKMEGIANELATHGFSGSTEFLAFYPNHRPLPDFFNAENKRRKEGNILVISPFVSKKTIQNIIDHFDMVVLITNPESLGKISKTWLESKTFKVYVPNEFFVHAKMYATDKDIYLGSFNASENAIRNNVETLVRFRRYGVRAFETVSGELLDEKKKMFLPVSADDSRLNAGEEGAEDTDNLAQEILREFLSLSPEGRFNKTSRELTVTTKRTFAPSEPFEIEPLQARTSSCRWEKGKKVVFKAINGNETAFSAFYKVTIGDNFSKVVIIPTLGLPDGREAAVLDAVINDTNVKDYILYWLDSGYLPSFEEREQETDGKKGSTFRGGEAFSGLYEKMLEAVCRKDAADVFEKLEKSLNPLMTDERLLKLIEKFKTTAKEAKKQCWT